MIKFLAPPLITVALMCTGCQTSLNKATGDYATVLANSLTERQKEQNTIVTDYFTEQMDSVFVATQLAIQAHPDKVNEALTYCKSACQELQKMQYNQGIRNMMIINSINAVAGIGTDYNKLYEEQKKAIEQIPVIGKTLMESMSN